MAENLKIQIGGKSFTLRPLTIGQLEDLHVGFLEPSSEGTPAELVRQDWQRNRQLLATALRLDHPEMTAEALRDLPGHTIQQVHEAVMKVLEFSGLVTKAPAAPTKAPAPGEAPAAASTGA